ncbi:MAG: hypothetical protein EOP49_22595, partial [Sphingobacteriales bacterium]
KRIGAFTRASLELQIAAGMPVRYGKCYPAQEENVCFSVFEYQDEYAGEYAGEEAFYMVQDLINGVPYDIVHTISRLRKLQYEGLQDPITGATEPEKPVIAVTGTNGKTTTTRLIAHLARTAGYEVGNTSSDGIYINGQLIEEGDTTGFLSAETILLDPSVNFAVLEVARGGILKSGLAFLHCDIGIVTNVAADHLGLKDIHSIEEMAEVKSVVVQAVRENGYSILNADDELVLQMRHLVNSKIALYSLDPENPAVLDHIAGGGVAAVLQHGCLVLYHGHETVVVAKADAIPLSMGGRARFNIANALAATLAAYAAGFDIETVRKGLCSFAPSAEQTPGRMNIFRFPDFEIMIDYAHNTHGLKALGGFLEATEATRKVGIIAVMGDRREEDITSLGATAAQLFDLVIIRENEDFRDRHFSEIRALLEQGIQASGSSCEVLVIPNEMAAIAYAVETAVPGSFITVISENIPEAIALLQRLQTAPVI